MAKYHAPGKKGVDRGVGRIQMYETRIKHLEEVHRVLDKRIEKMESTGVFEDEHLHTLKKQKLRLKDTIKQLKSHWP